MFDGGLLLLTSSALRLVAVSRLLQRCSEVVQGNLFVHLINSRECLKSHSCPTTVPYSGHVLKFINELYSRSANDDKCRNITVVIFNITNSEQRSVTQYSLNKSYQVVLTDIKEDLHGALKKYLQTHFPKCPVNSRESLLKLPIIPLNLNEVEAGTSLLDGGGSSLPQYNHVCLGGTFDYLHIGHKILLTQGALMAMESLVVGTTHGEMNKKKLLYELMEPTEVRMTKVTEFLHDIKQSLEYRVVPIEDPFGPSITDASLQAIAVSQETEDGATMINQERRQKGFSELQVEVIQLVYNDNCDDSKEKISSTTIRKQLLGTLLHEPEAKNIPRRPFVIGLTGGIASGKTSIGKRLEKLGAAVINCDLLGHRTYEPGSETFKKVSMAFGPQVVHESGTIDRKQLGGIVFKDKAKLSLLNSIVWPAIMELAKMEIDNLAKQGNDVVVLDAAVLLEAGWDNYVHEVWTSVIPIYKAESRIVKRNNISVEEAKQRIQSQMSNEDRVKRSNVVLCTLWDYEVTQKQVEKAWKLLQERMVH